MKSLCVKKACLSGLISPLLTFAPALADSGGAGTISGRGTDGSNGIQDLAINVHNSSGSWVKGCHTGADGAYTIDGLAAGDYKVSFRGGGYIHEWYDDTPDWNSADLVPVTSSGTVAGIDAVLAMGGGIGAL